MWNAISIDPNYNNFLKDGVITVNSLNCGNAAGVILKAGYYSFKLSFLKKDSKSSYQTLGTQLFSLRVLNCFDPLSLYISPRPSTCDTLTYSLNTLTPNPYLYYAQCTHFFDYQSYTSPLRSCANSPSNAGVQDFYQYLKYYVYRNDGGGVKTYINMGALQV